MTTGVSLCSNSHREFPVMNTWSLQWEQGFPVLKTGFSLWEFTTQGKPCSGPALALHWPCTGLQSSDIKLFLTKTRLQSKLNHTLKLFDHYLLPLLWSGRLYNTAHTTLLYKRIIVEIQYKIEDVCCIFLSKHDIRGRDLIKCAKNGGLLGPKNKQRTNQIQKRHWNLPTLPQPVFRTNPRQKQIDQQIKREHEWQRNT